MGVAAGGAMWFAGIERGADLAWGLTTAVASVPLLVGVVAGLIKRKAGVDVIAALAIVGSLALGEYLAGAIIALMLATGRALEGFANRRARRDLSALLERAPRTVTRYEDGRLVSLPVEDVQEGDLLLVKAGDVVPADGIVEGASAVLDDSALTGESRPVVRDAGASVSSGALNAGSSFDLRAAAYRSARRAVGAFEASASRTSRMMPA